MPGYFPDRLHENKIINEIAVFLIKYHSIFKQCFFQGDQYIYIYVYIYIYIWKELFGHVQKYLFTPKCDK